MPTYEYECTSAKCGHVFEKFQSITDAPLQRCPLCRCRVKRLIGSGAGIIFKGSGFYQTDYRSSAYHEKAKAEKQPAAAATPASGSGSEGKASAAPASPAKSTGEGGTKKTAK
jgi:putative FmdB family regulatory protein